MDTPPQSVTSELFAFVRSHVESRAQQETALGHCGDLAEFAIESVEPRDVEGRACRIVRYRFGLVTHHDEGARMRTVSAHMRLPADELAIESDAVSHECVEELNVDVPDVSDPRDFVTD